MPKFRVLAQQYVETVCEVEVEASSAEEARDLATKDKLAGATWTGGDDSYSPEIYAVQDASGNNVWER